MMAVIVTLRKVELRHFTLPGLPTMTTKPTMSRAELAKKGADTDLLREKIQVEKFINRPGRGLLQQ
jgi:hypothetical protein